MSNDLLNGSGLQDEIQSKTHSFIIKLWLEEFDHKHNRAVWRGHITHVADGKRHYFQHLMGMVNFIMSYLEEMGIRLDLPWHFMQWFERLTTASKLGNDDEHLH